MKDVLDKMALYEYHLQTCCTLNEDIDKKKPGYIANLNNKVMSLYGNDVIKAYEKAANYHGFRAKEEEEHANHDLYLDYESEVLLWIDQNINLGGEPKNTFTEFLSKKGSRK